MTGNRMLPYPAIPGEESCGLPLSIVQPPPPPPPPLPAPAMTRICTVAGCGSMFLRASVQRNVTTNVPAVLNWTLRGFCCVELAISAPPPKNHRNVKGVSSSASSHAPVKSTLLPADTVRPGAGARIVLRGVRFTVIVRVAGEGSGTPSASTHVKVMGNTPRIREDNLRVLEIRHRGHSTKVPGDA